MGAHANVTISSSISFCDKAINQYVKNVTYYVDTSSEPSMVSASVIMFVLAGLFFNLNLMSGLSDVSAILDPRVRLLLSSALSLFLPVMSYLFSEAKNAAGRANTGSVSSLPDDLSFAAGVILTWMLLVELLRKKVDEIRMRGTSGTIQRAGRVVWLGSLVFFNIQSAGRKAFFGILWVLCATKLVQRIAFSEVGKRSYSYGKNARLITSYMTKTPPPEEERHPVVDVGKDDDDVLKRCRYIVMGEEGLDIEPTADGYDLKGLDGASSPSTVVVTVGKIWRLAGQNDRIFTAIDRDHHLKRICLSFALFKLLRRRFEHLPEMSEAETDESRDLILHGLYADKTEESAAAVFQMMNNEVNFLSEYYHSVVPVVLASPFFFLANYFLLPIVVLFLCLMTVVVCGGGDMSFAFHSLKADNFAISSGVVGTTMCLLSNVRTSPAIFFTTLDFGITFLLYILFFYEEIWEFFVFLLSNWFVVSLLCNYAAKSEWRSSPMYTGFVRRIIWARRKMNISNPILSFKQFSVLNLRWPLTLGIPSMLSLLVRTTPVPDKVKHSIMESLCRRDAAAPLSNGKAALSQEQHGELLEFCRSESVAEVILTWQIATSILEVRCPPASSSMVATRLSKYCAYLVAFHPDLLPDNQDKAARVFEETKAELKTTLGCGSYYLSGRRARAARIMEAAGRKKGVVHDGARLAELLMKKTDTERWKILADVWTEMIIYVAPSSDEERLMGHENVLVQGGEFITVLWALTTHTGIARPMKNQVLVEHPQDRV